MRKIYRDGELIEVSDDYVLKDGERLNVGSFFMDAALVDADLNDAHSAYVDRLTRKDGDAIEDADERPAPVWHLVNPMMKDSHTPAPSQAVTVHDEGDPQAAYAARLSRRPVKDSDNSPDTARADYIARLTRR